MGSGDKRFNDVYLKSEGREGFDPVSQWHLDMHKKGFTFVSAATLEQGTREVTSCRSTDKEEYIGQNLKEATVMTRAHIKTVLIVFPRTKSSLLSLSRRNMTKFLTSSLKSLRWTRLSCMARPFLMSRFPVTSVRELFVDWKTRLLNPIATIISCFRLMMKLELSRRKMRSLCTEQTTQPATAMMAVRMTAARYSVYLGRYYLFWQQSTKDTPSIYYTTTNIKRNKQAIIANLIITIYISNCYLFL